MTREQFIKYKFKAYMEIDYIYPRSKAVISCMLLSVDFDCELIQLIPFPGQESIDGSFEYEYKPFTAHIQFCELTKRSQLKIVKK